MIYFDNNATTAMDPQVRETYQEALVHFGNPSSVHGPGRQARKLLNESREKIAELLKVKDSTLTFTSGGTEALNAALLGSFLPEPGGGHLVVSAVEHHAVLAASQFLERMGVEVTRVPVDPQGRLQVDQVALAIKPHTKMVAVMWANNETGNIYPVQAIGALAQSRGVLYLCDGVQACGKCELSLSELPVDFFAASAHKFHGPKGVGLLYMRDGLSAEPHLWGGRQERGRRAGTEHLAGIVAMAEALRLAQSGQKEKVLALQKLRDRLEFGILAEFSGARVLGDRENRLPGTLNILLPGIQGETALVNLDRAGIAISIGAACESGSVDPSHVLLAMGLEENEAASGLRFSLSKDNTDAEVEVALKTLSEVLKPLTSSI